MAFSLIRRYREKFHEKIREIFIQMVRKIFMKILGKFISKSKSFDLIFWS